MRNRVKRDQNFNAVSATNSSPRPGDFEVGSPKSRAAARAVIGSYTEAWRSQENDELTNLTESELAIIEDVPNPWYGSG